MSKSSFAIYKVARGWMIPFLFALAFLQVPEANATSRCESGCHSDECSCPRLKIKSVLGVESYFQPIPTDIKIEVTPFVVLPCGVIRHGQPQQICLSGVTQDFFNLNYVERSFPATPGEYTAGVNVSFESVSDTFGITLTLSHSIVSSHHETIVIPVSYYPLFDYLGDGSSNFQLNNSFIYPFYLD